MGSSSSIPDDKKEEKKRESDVPASGPESTLTSSRGPGASTPAVAPTPAVVAPGPASMVPPAPGPASMMPPAPGPASMMPPAPGPASMMPPAPGPAPASSPPIPYQQKLINALRLRRHEVNQAKKPDTANDKLSYDQSFWAMKNPDDSNKKGIEKLKNTIYATLKAGLKHNNPTDDKAETALLQNVKAEIDKIFDELDAELRLIYKDEQDHKYPDETVIAKKIEDAKKDASNKIDAMFGPGKIQARTPANPDATDIANLHKKALDEFNKAFEEYSLQDLERSRLRLQAQAFIDAAKSLAKGKDKDASSDKLSSHTKLASSPETRNGIEREVEVDGVKFTLSYDPGKHAVRIDYESIGWFRRWRGEKIRNADINAFRLLSEFAAEKGVDISNFYIEHAGSSDRAHEIQNALIEINGQLKAGQKGLKMQDDVAKATFANEQERSQFLAGLAKVGDAKAQAGKKDADQQIINSTSGPQWARPAAPPLAPLPTTQPAPLASSLPPISPMPPLPPTPPLPPGFTTPTTTPPPGFTPTSDPAALQAQVRELYFFFSRELANAKIHNARIQAKQEHQERLVNKILNGKPMEEPEKLVQKQFTEASTLLAERIKTCDEILSHLQEKAATASDIADLRKVYNQMREASPKIDHSLEKADLFVKAFYHLQAPKMIEIKPSEPITPNVNEKIQNLITDILNLKANADALVTKLLDNKICNTQQVDDICTQLKSIEVFRLVALTAEGYANQNKGNLGALTSLYADLKTTHAEAEDALNKLRTIAQKITDASPTISPAPAALAVSPTTPSLAPVTTTTTAPSDSKRVFTPSPEALLTATHLTQPSKTKDKKGESKDSESKQTAESNPAYPAQCLINAEALLAASRSYEDLFRYLENGGSSVIPTIEKYIAYLKTLIEEFNNSGKKDANLFNKINETHADIFNFVTQQIQDAILKQQIYFHAIDEEKAIKLTTDIAQAVVDNDTPLLQKKLAEAISAHSFVSLHSGSTAIEIKAMNRLLHNALSAYNASKFSAMVNQKVNTHLQDEFNDRVTDLIEYASAVKERLQPPTTSPTPAIMPPPASKQPTPDSKAQQEQDRIIAEVTDKFKFIQKCHQDATSIAPQATNYLTEINKALGGAKHEYNLVMDAVKDSRWQPTPENLLWMRGALKNIDAYERRATSLLDDLTKAYREITTLEQDRDEKKEDSSDRPTLQLKDLEGWEQQTLPTETDGIEWRKRLATHGLFINTMEFTYADYVGMIKNYDSALKEAGKPENQEAGSSGYINAQNAIKQAKDLLEKVWSKELKEGSPQAKARREAAKYFNLNYFDFNTGVFSTSTTDPAGQNAIRDMLYHHKAAKFAATGKPGPTSEERESQSATTPSIDAPSVAPASTTTTTSSPGSDSIPSDATGISKLIAKADCEIIRAEMAIAILEASDYKFENKQEVINSVKADVAQAKLYREDISNLLPMTSSDTLAKARAAQDKYALIKKNCGNAKDLCCTAMNKRMKATLYEGDSEGTPPSFQNTDIVEGLKNIHHLHDKAIECYENISLILRHDRNNIALKNAKACLENIVKSHMDALDDYYYAESHILTPTHCKQFLHASSVNIATVKTYLDEMQRSLARITPTTEAKRTPEPDIKATPPTSSDARTTSTIPVTPTKVPDHKVRTATTVDLSALENKTPAAPASSEEAKGSTRIPTTPHKETDLKEAKSPGLTSTSTSNPARAASDTQTTLRWEEAPAGASLPAATAANASRSDVKVGEIKKDAQTPKGADSEHTDAKATPEGTDVGAPTSSDHKSSHAPRAQGPAADGRPQTHAATLTTARAELMARIITGQTTSDEKALLTGLAAARVSSPEHNLPAASRDTAAAGGQTPTAPGGAAGGQTPTAPTALATAAPTPVSVSDSTPLPATTSTSTTAAAKVKTTHPGATPLPGMTGRTTVTRLSDIGRSTHSSTVRSDGVPGETLAAQASGTSSEPDSKTLPDLRERAATFGASLHSPSPASVARNAAASQLPASTEQSHSGSIVKNAINKIEGSATEASKAKLAADIAMRKAQRKAAEDAKKAAEDAKKAAEKAKNDGQAPSPSPSPGAPKHR